MDKRLDIPAKNTLDLQPQGSWQAASEGGVSVTAWGSRIMVGIMSRTARRKTPCVKGGTHSNICIVRKGCGGERLGHCTLEGSGILGLLRAAGLGRGKAGA